MGAVQMNREAPRTGPFLALPRLVRAGAPAPVGPAKATPPHRAASADVSSEDPRAAEMSRYVGWSHLPPGGEIGVIESIELDGALVWLHVRLSDDKIERRSFVADLDHLLDERAFAADRK